MRVLPTAFKPVLQQIRSLQVASIRTSDIYWIKVQASYTMRASYVTCCKQVRRGKFGKTRDMYRFCCKKYNNPLISAITLDVLQQLDMLQYRFMIRGWQNPQNRRYSTISFVAVLQHVASFCCPFCRGFDKTNRFYSPSSNWEL